MIIRLTQRLAKKIKRSPSLNLPIGGNAYADWSAHLFTAERAQYIIVSNTTSLYSIVMHGSGITDSNKFMQSVLSYMADFMQREGQEFLFRRLIVPESQEVIFSKSANRSVMGSMNDFISTAKFLLIERELSPFEMSKIINGTPMKILGYDSPKEAFAKMALGKA
jgi:IS30 family transposase